MGFRAMQPFIRHQSAKFSLQQKRDISSMEEYVISLPRTIHFHNKIEDVMVNFGGIKLKDYADRTAY